MEFFDVDAIIESEKKKDIHEFTLEQFEDDPILTINVSRDIKTRAKAAKKRYNNIQGGFKDGESTWQPIDEPEKYIDSVLGFCFADFSKYPPETPLEKKKKAFIIQATDNVDTAKRISSMLMDFFDGKTESDDTKN